MKVLRKRKLSNINEKHVGKSDKQNGKSDKQSMIGISTEIQCRGENSDNDTIIEKSRKDLQLGKFSIELPTMGKYTMWVDDEGHFGQQSLVKSFDEKIIFDSRDGIRDLGFGYYYSTYSTPYSITGSIESQTSFKCNLVD